MVGSESGVQSWALTARRQGRNWLLEITDPVGHSWTAEGPDLFEAVRALRRALDPLGIRLGTNGAHRNAWASGMQRDMGEGRVVYLLSEGQRAGGRRKSVPWDPRPWQTWVQSMSRTSITRDGSTPGHQLSDRLSVTSRPICGKIVSSRRRWRCIKIQPDRLSAGL
jgi:hypothetical protein